MSHCCSCRCVLNPDDCFLTPARRLPLHFLKPGILLLHIILFLMLWVIFAGFLFILLNPLLKRVSKEVRCMLL